MLQINVPSRLHMTLIDLGAKGYRRNGGIGFCIDSPMAKFKFQKNSSIDLSALFSHGYSDAEVRSLADRLAREREIFGGTGLRLQSASLAERHIGFGVGTATAMATIEALHVLNGHSITPEEVMRRSGRGGTSGIGVHGYFSGGFIFDVGRKFDTNVLMSSDDVAIPTSIPLAIAKTEMPGWQIGVFYARDAIPVSIQTERALFSSALPLSAEDVYRTTYHAVFGAMAAIADHDFDAFCLAVNEIQDTSWKRHEIALHGTSILSNMDALRDAGCDAVGMSSVGPILYFLARDFSTTVDRIKIRFPDADIFTAFPRNVGRDLIHA